MQTKYLGRQWRKSNMKTMSAIYAKVRHRLNDDWAYGNGENRNLVTCGAKRTVGHEELNSFVSPYRVTLVVKYLGCVDLDLGCSTILLGQ